MQFPLDGVLAALGALAGTVPFALTMLRRQERNWARVEILWAAYIRREKADAVNTGAAVAVNSPLILSDKGREWMQPIAERLKLFYATEGYKLSEDELYIAIETRFSKDLLKLDSERNNLRGAVAVAVATAKEGYAPTEAAIASTQQKPQ